MRHSLTEGKDITIEHATIPEAGLHEPKGASTATVGEVYVSDGAGSGGWEPAKIEGQTTASANTVPKNDGAGGITWVDNLIDVSNILEGQSFSDQDPTGLDTPLQVEFGPAINTTEMDLSAAGLLTINVPGTYELDISARFGRTTAIGVSNLIARITLNGTQIFNTAAQMMDDGNFSVPFSASLSLLLVASDVIKLEIVRDSGGIDNGGFHIFNPVLAGWDTAPSASIRTRKLSVA